MSSIGFGAPVREKIVKGQQGGAKAKALGPMDVEHTDLISYGLIPEFIGRFPIIVTLQELQEAELMKVRQPSFFPPQGRGRRVPMEASFFSNICAISNHAMVAAARLLSVRIGS